MHDFQLSQGISHLKHYVELQTYTRYVSNCNELRDAVQTDQFKQLNCNIYSQRFKS